MWMVVINCFGYCSPLVFVKKGVFLLKNIKLVAMIEAAFFAAFALILDLLPSIKLTPFVSISAAMVPIFIVAFRWGFRVSLISGFLWGLLQVVTGDVYYLQFFQFLIEYFIAFAFIGFAGLFYPIIQKHLHNRARGPLILWMVAAIFVGSFARYIWHFIAGVIFWGSYAPKGMSPVWYSFIVNGGTMLGAAILCSMAMIILVTASPRLLIRKDGTAVKKEF
jgi:thiamine transporter